MVCPNSARPSTLQGAVLRVHLVSDNGNSYEVDVSARNELAGGLVMDNWASLTISARNDKVDLYVDNIVVQWRQRWVRGSSSEAFPSLQSLDAPLSAGCPSSSWHGRDGLSR